jgi:hypothetical protein
MWGVPSNRLLTNLTFAALLGLKFSKSSSLMRDFLALAGWLEDHCLPAASRFEALEHSDRIGEKETGR